MGLSAGSCVTSVNGLNWFTSGSGIFSPYRYNCSRSLIIDAYCDDDDDDTDDAASVDVTADVDAGILDVAVVSL